MDNLNEKIKLLHEMIAFALVDGELHNKEYDFLELIATDFGIEKHYFLTLFSQKPKKIIQKDAFTRICQFYRLALLMFSDGIIHEKEFTKINEIGITMGLNPEAMKKALELMQKSKNQCLDAETLTQLFSIQDN